MLDRITRELGCLLLCLGFSSSSTAAVCLVDANASGANLGGSWADAYIDLQSALGNAGCAEVWVAKGTYRPTLGVSRSISFNVRPGLAVHGGFVGNESNVDARNLAANPTVLSGDIGAAGDATDNSYHVVVIDGTTGAGGVDRDTVVDGFTISGGQAADDTANNSGGGLYCNGSFGHFCNPTLSNLKFTGNSANYGGAMFADGYAGQSSPLLSAVQFVGNTAVFDGGAIYAFGAGSGAVRAVEKDHNSGFYGGVLYATSYGDASVSQTLNSVTLTSNKTTGSGAAIYNDASGGATTQLQLTNAILWGDAATYPNPEIYKCCAGATATITHSNVLGSHGSGAQWLTALGTDAGGNIDLDSMLSLLQYNGGPTVTMMPGITLALNLGTNSGCPDTDQRGVVRPQPLGGACDMGAVERQVFEDYIFNTRFEVY